MVRRASPREGEMLRRPAEDLFMQEEEGGEGLILGTGGDASIRCQIRKKLFDSVIAEVARMRHSVIADVPFDPPDIGSFRSEAVMSKPAFSPDPVEQLGLFHYTLIGCMLLSSILVGFTPSIIREHSGTAASLRGPSLEGRPLTLLLRESLDGGDSCQPDIRSPCSDDKRSFWQGFLQFGARQCVRSNTPTRMALSTTTSGYSFRSSSVQRQDVDRRS